jgi:hypothetical protein
MQENEEENACRGNERERRGGGGIGLKRDRVRVKPVKAISIFSSKLAYESKKFFSPIL